MNKEELIKEIQQEHSRRTDQRDTSQYDVDKIFHNGVITGLEFVLILIDEKFRDNAQLKNSSQDIKS